jgi:Ni,Fe-hydrogenase III component G
MFVEKQPTTVIDKKQLVASVADLKKNGYRLVVITAVLSDVYDITYSFDKEGVYTALRLSFPKAETTIPSITGVYLAAFTYENELQDLFGLTITDMALNFGGKFYKLAMKNPFTVPKTTTAAK